MSTYLEYEDESQVPKEPGRDRYRLTSLIIDDHSFIVTLETVQEKFNHRRIARMLNGSDDQWLLERL